MEIQHFSHEEHPLFLKDDKTTDDQECGMCRSNIVAPFYGCDLCGYYLHKSCAQLPRFLNHSFHPSHPLELRYLGSNYYCDSCQKEFSHSLGFGCAKCNFDMDVECATMPPITFTEVDPKNIIQHFSHQHPMPLVKIDSKDEIDCFGCQSVISSNDQVYGCTKCKYFLHKSCAELPKVIQYPFHEHDCLFDLRITYYEKQCGLCDKRYKRIFAFECRECDFNLCVKCCPTRGTFQYDYHEHLLYFAVERKTKHFSQCNGYDSYCKRPVVSSCKELSDTTIGAFFCLECEFKLHLLCGPLPSIIKHECHIDSLILVDSLVENNYGEYYCDICETERDPRIRVYYCQKCRYFAHVHCVASEIILKIVKGELKDVKLKNVGDDFWKTDDNDDDQPPIDPSSSSSSLFTLKDLLNSLSPYEKGWLKRRYRWNDDEDASTSYKGEAEESNKLGDADYDDHILPILQLSRFTHQDFRNFFKELEKFYDNNQLELKSRDLGLKIVTSVKGYKIPLLFQPLLIKLIYKYGDVCPSRSSYFKTIEGKSMVYFLLCKVVKEMCSTQVGDITRNLLQQWYFHLSFVSFWGEFKIDFALAHLEELVRAFMGHQAKRLEDEIPAIISEKIAKLQQGLKKCEEYKGSSSKSEFMEECLKKDSESKWKNACEGLLSDPQPQGPRPHYSLWP